MPEFASQTLMGPVQPRPPYPDGSAPPLSSRGGAFPDLAVQPHPLDLKQAGGWRKTESRAVSPFFRHNPAGVASAVSHQVWVAILEISSPGRPISFSHIHTLYVRCAGSLLTVRCSLITPVDPYISINTASSSSATLLPSVSLLEDEGSPRCRVCPHRGDHCKAAQAPVAR